MTAFKTTQTEKRSCERRTYKAPIRLTHFNGGHWLDARTLNYCLEGMCVKSNVRFQPGAAILIRVEYGIRVEHGTSDVSGTCIYEGLPTMTLAEVKWCREITDASLSSYELGVKYYAPVY